MVYCTHEDFYKLEISALAFANLRQKLLASTNEEERILFEVYECYQKKIYNLKYNAQPV